MTNNINAQEVIREKLYKDITVEIKATPIIPAFNSSFQKIALYENQTMGKILLLDDIVQFATQDEYVLHEALAYWPYCAKEEALDVLIVGGGDLGVASRFLSLPSIRNVTVVDIDPEVTRVTCEYLSEVSQGVENDPRLRIVHEDAASYIKTFAEKSFDIVVADTTDEVSIGESLYSKDFLSEIYRVLKDKGIVMRLAGSFFLQGVQVGDIFRKMKGIFSNASCGLLGLPLNMYQGGLYVVVVGVKNGIFNEQPMRELEIKGRWYSRDVHAAIAKIVPQGILPDY